VPSSSFAAHLAVSAPVTSPGSFLATAETWIISRLREAVDTPEERSAIKKAVLDVYDAIASNAAKANAFLGMLFGAMRPSIENWIDTLLKSIVPLPTPAPLPVSVTPQGSSAQ
jgi:hypothetical protein